MALSFWSSLNCIIQRKLGNIPLLFCGDANAHLGEVVTTSVGPHAPAAENQAGKLFHEWLLQHQLFAPATFTATCTSGQAHTFVSPNGHSARIGYVAVPGYFDYEHIFKPGSTKMLIYPFTDATIMLQFAM